MAFCKIFIFSSQIKTFLKFQHSLLLTFKTVDCHYLLAFSSVGRTLGPAWFLFLGSLFGAWMFKNIFFSFVMQKPQAKSRLLSVNLIRTSVSPFSLHSSLPLPQETFSSYYIFDYHLFPIWRVLLFSRTTVILACLFSLNPVSTLYLITLIFVPFSPDSQKSFYLSQYVFYPAQFHNRF